MGAVIEKRLASARDDLVSMTPVGSRYRLEFPGSPGPVRLSE